MKSAVATILSLVLVAAMAGWVVAAEPSPQTRPALGTKPSGLQEDPSLPNVLLIGDSVSFGYTDAVKELLRGKANVTWNGNAQASVTAVLYATAAAKSEKKWAVIHFNYGLWDVSHDWRWDDKGKLSGQAGTTPEEYAKNLRAGIEVLKTTGAKIIFATTTPVGTVKVDKWDSVHERNDIAKKIMQENGIAIDDLYSAFYPNQADLLLPDGIHQNQKGNEILARSVAASIEAQLASKETPATHKADQADPK